ncbi:MAG: ATP-binding protein [bacterium]
MKQYKTRIVDRILREKLESKGAVLIEGAKWCGKTTTASQLAKSILYMQDPEKVRQNIELAELKPSKLLEGEAPRLIDEWQLAPKLWDAIRFEVDQRDAFGQFILTGSSVPADTSKIYHSGVGRITKLLMRPMSLFESGESNGSVSLKQLFEGKLVDGYADIDIDQLAFLICRGGWPKALDCSEKIALAQAFDYYTVVVNTDASKVDNVERNPERVERLMRSYARAIASQTNLRSIGQDLANHELKTLSDDTINAYISALKRIFVIEEVGAWNPNLRSKTAIRTSNTRYFTDPSIGTAALGLGPQDLIQNLHTMGLFFENLCIRDLRVYAESLNGTVYHYRDRNGLECDAVVHLRNGQYGLVEIKLGGDKAIAEGIETLNKLSDQIDTSVMKPPAFKMILTGLGNIAYTQKDGIHIVPVGCLRD